MLGAEFSFQTSPRRSTTRPFVVSFRHQFAPSNTGTPASPFCSAFRLFLPARAAAVEAGRRA
jgi:hypothetical protein